MFPVYRAVFFGLLLLYAAGFALPLTLPLLTLAHILPPTLHNSQGFTFHGNQIMSLTLVGLSEDNARFRMRNSFYRLDGQRVATITSTGGWLDLAARRLVPPPVALAHAVLAIPRDPVFTPL